ncbi:hypothetical protein B0H63DRAFT_133569 [Podospora didyma]|uniref:Uncharacterized protein n=1 Tax=Podospora didyma TaxID=330526 RepID=A0AAE0P0X6_9PEZI|nr:hypothetical protein B0H63DRAFT_133569 [Podospora didyma]
MQHGYQLSRQRLANCYARPEVSFANFWPFLLFATPLNEVSGVTACCSAIIDWLSCSPAEAEQAADCIRFRTPWESPVASESGGTSESKRRQLIDGRADVLEMLGHPMSPTLYFWTELYHPRNRNMPAPGRTFLHAHGLSIQLITSPAMGNKQVVAEVCTCSSPWRRAVRLAERIIPRLRECTTKNISCTHPCLLSPRKLSVPLRYSDP